MVKKKNEDEEKQITLSNTKKEMLEAYNELLKQLQEKEAQQIVPEKKAEEKTAREVVKTADSLTIDGVVQGINTLKFEIGKLLNEISDKLENEVKRFGDIQAAIAVKEKELQEVYEISRAAQSLAALIEAHNREKEEFEQEMSRRREELAREIESTRQQWNSEVEKHKELLKEQQEEERKHREREKEEYLYDFARHKKVELDKLQDEKEKQKRDFQQEIEEKEKELLERENEVKTREEELALLRKKVDNFPKELEAATSRVTKETTERLQKEFTNTEALLKKDFAGEKNVFLTKIESMEKTIKQQQEEIDKLSRQLESAYKRIEDIAVKTVSTQQTWKPVYQQEENKKQ